MTPQELNQKLAALEALLFIHGEPIAVEKIGKTLKISPAETKELLAEFEKRLGAEGRGLHLISMDDRYQMATKPELNSALEDFVKSELTEELTPASLEVLSIVSYLGPISRSRLEYIRGVNSSFILRNLLLRGLVDRHPDPEYTLAYLYQPSFELLQHLGAKSPKDLPEYEKFKTLLTAVETAPAPAENPESPKPEGAI
jgi:segregation and condensation protein B